MLQLGSCHRTVGRLLLVPLRWGEAARRHHSGSASSPPPEGQASVPWPPEAVPSQDQASPGVSCSAPPPRSPSHNPSPRNPSPQPLPRPLPAKPLPKPPALPAMVKVPICGPCPHLLRPAGVQGSRGHRENPLYHAPRRGRPPHSQRTRAPTQAGAHGRACLSPRESLWRRPKYQLPRDAQLPGELMSPTPRPGHSPLRRLSPGGHRCPDPRPLGDLRKHHLLQLSPHTGDRLTPLFSSRPPSPQDAWGGAYRPLLLPQSPGHQAQGPPTFPTPLWAHLGP